MVHLLDSSTIKTLKIASTDIPRSSCFDIPSSNRQNDSVEPSYSLHIMTGSPLEAHPLPGTSKFFSTEEDENIPPPYAAQQALPPYSFCPPNNALGQPRTISVPFGSGVTFEWSPVIPQSPDDIIFVTVRINKLGPRQSFDGHLPQR